MIVVGCYVLEDELRILCRFDLELNQLAWDLIVILDVDRVVYV